MPADMSAPPPGAAPTAGETLLDVRDLCVSFRSERGIIRILENVSFTVGQREILSIVGESGSGKSMTSLAVMRLITDPNAIITGTITYKGRDLLGLDARAMRALRGREIAMIFQDPMTAMTPVYTIGWQIEEQLRAHQKLSRQGGAGARRRPAGRDGHARPRRARRRATRTSFRAACASAR